MDAFRSRGAQAFHHQAPFPIIPTRHLLGLSLRDRSADEHLYLHRTHRRSEAVPFDDLRPSSNVGFGAGFRLNTHPHHA